MNNRYFEIAKLAALKSKHRVKIGAVLIKSGKPVAIGFNKVGKTHPKAKWFIHAELDCLLGNHRFDLTGSTMYLYRTNNFGKILLCKPCSQCQDLLRENGVKKVYYTNDQYKLMYEPLFMELEL